MKKTAAMPSPTLRPRNPLAAPARCRGGAGRHGPQRGARRQRSHRALRRELQDLHPPHC
jgi:hypothetical protein